MILMTVGFFVALIGASIPVVFLFMGNLRRFRSWIRGVLWIIAGIVIYVTGILIMAFSADTMTS
jgi:hypothetical protein